MHVAKLCLTASLYSYFQHPASLYNPNLASLYIGRIHFFSLLDWASYGLLALFRGACRIGRLSVSEVLPGDSPM